jgi:uncharacterized protein (UPF0179 family)|tara:strand:- start:1388 stop:1603 length:216 start_codon:yes stop_codon:yes gene_type:complete
MIKVEKTSSYEIVAQVKQYFEGATIEEATQKAQSSKDLNETADIKITDSKFIQGNIKKIGEESNNSNVEQQ